MIKALGLSCLFWMTLILVSCSKNKEADHQDDEVKKIKLDILPADIIVPSKVWDLLEFKDPNVAAAHHGDAHGAAAGHGGGGGHEAKAEGGGHGGGGGEGGGHGDGKAKSAVQSKETTIADVILYLEDITEGVVKDGPVKILLPKGGGEIDLSDYITDVDGSFYFRLEFLPFESVSASSSKVIFQSKSRRRQLENKVWGAGCNQILDVTKIFLSTMSKKGLKVNSNRQRHVTVLGGTFFFSAQTETGFSVAQVTIKDSKNKHLFCGAK